MWWSEFEAAMPDVPAEAQQRFYYQNMADLLGPALTPAAAPAA